ncbi:cytochrome c biogenesis protein CcsA [Thalassotalea sp. G2M2-11]|uniref:cytochrome c biogenesis protein n=1 Tax=Thalassotalea sp. G2M2-11 TaxID=2787627 RepID=UPI0019D0ECA8|nr:cytochrome c biogenesis protein CcsA [Thalassotalea sp. G2M2-11]
MDTWLTTLSSHHNELLFLWAALVFYVCSGSLSIITTIVWRQIPPVIPYLSVLGFSLHTLAIALRWYRVDHGPFVTMFEILSSNIWSFTLIWLFFFWRIKEIRFALVIAQPVLFMMMAWLLLAPSQEAVYPATYHTIWLYIHVGFGKVFLALFYLAVALSSLILLRKIRKCRLWFSQLPADENLAVLAFRFVAVGLIFQTLMLIAGAIWAQDAWGRYWAWDSLETWSFISWLLVALLLHARVTWKIKPDVSSIMIIIVFIVAFVTFFGVPFISMTPHRGVV